MKECLLKSEWLVGLRLLFHADHKESAIGDWLKSTPGILRV